MLRHVERTILNLYACYVFLNYVNVSIIYIYIYIYIYVRVRACVCTRFSLLKIVSVLNNVAKISFGEPFLDLIT